jgi:glycine cleavage system H protein
MASSTHQIIPPGEQYCVWMDAGVVEYKLCPLHFACEDCTFDAKVRMQQNAPRITTTHRRKDLTNHRPDTVTSSRTAEDYCAQSLQTLLGTIESQTLPQDRLYASNHTWAKDDGRGSFVLGIDHFIGTMLKGAHSVAFSVPPAHIKAAEPYAWIVTNGETLAVRSPIAGTIVENNAELANHSSTLQTDPYTRGWISKIRPEQDAFTHLLQPQAEMLHVVHHDCDRYKSSINTELQRLQIPLEGTMYDGGTVLENFEDILGSKKYYEILERFLRAVKTVE